MSWQTVQLAEVADIERKGVDPSNIDPDTNYLGLENIESGGRIISCQRVQNGELASTKFQFGPDHVLYGKLRPYLAKIALPDFEGICSTDILPVRPGPKLDRSFLAHSLRQPRLVDFASSRSTGANLPRLSPKALGAFEIPLPTLDEQKRIAGILDQADALRRLRAQALDKLNTLGQAIFHEMFGDPLNDHLSTAGWVCEPLDRNTHYIDYRGKTPPKAEDGIRLITAKNVRMGSINLEPMEFIESEAYDTWMTRGFPQKGDVLFTTEAPLGNVAILDSSEKLVVGQRLITMQPDQSKILSEYLAFFLRSHGFVRKMIENSSGSTVRGIKSRLLKKIEICYPPLHTQSQFAKSLHQVTKLAKRAEISKMSSECLFASLQHCAFRGEF